jgi:hypothetical protein
MIRKINFTGRKKIRRNKVRVDIQRNAGGRRIFNILIDLAEMGLDSEARVYVEAYHRTGYQRFDFGSVGERRLPEDRCLSHFADSILPLFRVKVVDRRSAHGRILASLDRIRPESVENQPSGSHSLLFVEYEDLGNQIWQLDLEGDWPVLKLNHKVDDIGLVASLDTEFSALVYPEVLRQILTRILLEEEHTDPHCDDDWPSLWLQLASCLQDVGEPPTTRGEQTAWIDRATEAFAAKRDFINRFNQSFQSRR